MSRYPELVAPEIQSGKWRAVQKEVWGDEDADYYDVEWSEIGELVSDGVYGKANADAVAAIPAVVDSIRRAIAQLEAMGKHGEYSADDVRMTLLGAWSALGGETREVKA